MATPQVTVEIANQTQASLGQLNGLSTSDSEKLQSIFAASPIHSGQYKAEEARKLYLKVLKEKVIDGGHMFGTFDPRYDAAGGDSVGAPNITAEVTPSAGNDGGPGSPHLPNPMSPGPGLASPEKQPKPPEKMRERNDGVPFTGEGSALEPKDSSKNVSDQLFTDLPMGKSKG